MKKVLQCLGICVYSIIASYLLWLLFYWITPIVMGAGWTVFIICMLFLPGIITLLPSLCSMALSLLLVPLTANNIVAKIINAIPFLLLGIDAVCLPWQLDMEYKLLQWLLGISLTSTFAITFIYMLIFPFIIDKTE